MAPARSPHRSRDRRLPMRRFLTLVVLLLTLIVAALAGMVALEMDLSSGVRAYVTGEALWSKAQKTAVLSLQRYLVTSDPAEWARFREALEIEHGDERARQALLAVHPDRAKARAGFLVGRNSPEDVPALIRLLTRFGWVGRVKRVVAIWSEGDFSLARLSALGDEIHLRVGKAPLPEAERRAYFVRIAAIDDGLTKLEDEFSFTLGDIARWLHQTVFRLIVLVCVFLLAAALWAARHFAGVLEREEEAFRQSEQEYRDLVDFSPIGIYRTTRDGRILSANRSLARLLEYETPEEMLRLDMGRDVYFDPADRARLIERGEGRSEVHGLELLYKTSSGSPVWVRVDYRQALDSRGEPYYEGFVHDISERRRSDETMRESEERYRVLFEESPLALLLYDPSNRRILAANSAAAGQYGYVHDEFLALRLDDLHAPEDHERLLAEIVPAGSGRRSAGTWKSLRKDGTPLHVDIHTADMALGGMQLRFALLLDVSEKIRLEEQIRQAQKMEAVGRLAGGVAHDFNNLLTVILGYGNLIMATLPQEAAERDPLEQIVVAGERAATLTRQLLAFSRKQVLAPQILDLDRVVTDMDKMLHRVIGEDIELISVRAPDLGCVLADPGQIEQILVNLAVNARDAMPRGGRLTIETRNVEILGTESEEPGPTPPGSYVLLLVTDTGSGMDDETMAHIFEPFFTTKETGKGTGLGLATVHGIVKQSGGSIQVSSEKNRGTSFRIYLPRSVESDGDSTSAHGLSSHFASQKSDTILLVEDEPAVRRLALDILAGAGYQVLESTDTGAALTLAREHPGPIHLMLTDVVMPGLGGPDLAVLVRALRPEIRVLFMSGYSDEAILRHGFVEENTAFLGKPFSPGELVEKVRAILAHRLPANVA